MEARDAEPRETSPDVLALFGILLFNLLNKGFRNGAGCSSVSSQPGLTRGGLEAAAYAESMVEGLGNQTHAVIPSTRARSF